MHFIKTPLLYSDSLSTITQNNVYLKLELLQPSGSFKNRGIGHYCTEKAKEGAREFVCSSGGNAGLAASYSAKKLNLPITVVLPHTTPQMMIDKIKSNGANVMQKGSDWQEADLYAQSLCKEQGVCYVPPFDDPLIWKGNATLIHELAESGLRPDAVVLSVGGGGLLCGVVEGVKAVGWESVPVFAVETSGAASFAAAMKAGHVVELDAIDSVAKSLGARAVSEQAVECSKKHPIISKVVSDKSSILACCKLAKEHRLLVEPACGAALSLCYEKDPDLLDFQNILIIVCGGSVVTPKMLKSWLEAVGVSESIF